MGCVTGKLNLTLDDKMQLEISKNRGEDFNVRLVNLLENRDKFSRKDKRYIIDETVKHLKNLK